MLANLNKSVFANGLVNYDNILDKKLSDNFKIIYYRIDKAREVPYNKLTDELRFIRFIGAEDKNTRAEIAKGDKMLMEFDNWLDDYVNDEETKKYFGKWAEVIATNKGLKKGEKSGLKKGEQRGKQKAQESIAKNMINNNYEIEEIMKLTKLSREEIEKLIEQN